MLNHQQHHQNLWLDRFYNICEVPDLKIPDEFGSGWPIYVCSVVLAKAPRVDVLVDLFYKERNDRM